MSSIEEIHKMLKYAEEKAQGGIVDHEFWVRRVKQLRSMRHNSILRN